MYNKLRSGIVSEFGVDWHRTEEFLMRLYLVINTQEINFTRSYQLSIIFLQRIVSVSPVNLCITTGHAGKVVPSQPSPLLKDLYLFSPFQVESLIHSILSIWGLF